MPCTITWLNWSAEAFARARAEDKPVLLDIGATWCHWCHVMQRTTYSDPEVVEVVEEQYIPVHVDADARPDINSRYNRGGWPTTAFLTPDGEFMGGGTYIPPAQMKRQLLDYAAFYHQNTAEIRRKVDESRKKHQDKEQGAAAIVGEGLDNTVVDQAVAEIRAHADMQRGGLGRAPKFPHPEPITLALLRYHGHRDETMLNFAGTTLDAMAAGGLRDQIGGGFHRYAIDGDWHLPHFEKLLDVNAAMLSAYAAGYRALGNASYREVAEGIMCFMEDVLSSSGPCFYSSQDADTREGDDGAYFTWTLSEVEDALPGQQAEAARAFYGMTPAGNIQSTPGRNALYQAMSHEQLAARLGGAVADAKATLAEATTALEEARSRRQPPDVDKKIITNWNCLAAEAYFDAWEAFGRAGCRSRALAIVDFLLYHAVGPEGEACHYLKDDLPRVPGLLTDQASLANACLDAYETTGSRKYLYHAQELVRIIDQTLASPSGGYFDRPATDEGHGELAIRTRSIFDNAETARALARLHMLTGEAGYLDHARLALAVMRPEFAKLGYLAAGYALAVDLLVNYPVELVTVGPPDSPQTRALHEAALKLYEPRRMVQLLDPTADADLMTKKGYATPDKPTLFMCRNAACAPPIHTPEQLQEAYEHFEADLLASATQPAA
ncbi:MAG: thioredoxin domain-containing protein [Planctomycetes bacterium]|nr:thioredoxin domain-containing protein [Planctomycetota bacterium]